MSTRTSGVTASADESQVASSTPGLQKQVLLLQTGEASSRELVEAALTRAEATQSALNAFRVICAEEALAKADEADRRLGAAEGAPLLGAPVAIKDDVHLTGHTSPFGCGGGSPAVRDAEAVRRLREAGAIVIGKTHAPEVGQWHFTETPLHGATRNPWNTDHTPGGSSGGAAAAVAAGVVPSEPIAAGTTPAATAAAAPPLEPPGVWSVFQGLRVAPCSGVSVKCH